MRNPYGWIVPNWPVPAHVHAITTTRDGGTSLPPYNTLNLSDRVHDDKNAVIRNQSIAQKTLHLSTPPCWLRQDHGTRVVRFDSHPGNTMTQADAAITQHPGIVCSVLTADCLPIFLFDEKNNQVGAIHAGWRGLAQGVIESCIATMATTACSLIAWLGPAIGPNAFAVGTVVYDLFVAQDIKAKQAFSQIAAEHWLADIYQLARLRLKQLGVNRIYGGEYCTFHDKRFFSYRRDGGITGRMASLIWLSGS